MATNSSAPMDPVDRIGALADPLRRRLYDLVCDQDAPITRDQVCEATAVARATAAYHLDKLVEYGLLAADYARPPGRRGPGAGRPAKYYRRADEEIKASTPPRDYELLARLLSTAIDSDSGGVLGLALEAAARDAGRGAARATGADESTADGHLTAALQCCGYQPRSHDGEIELRNCPFHRLAQEHRDLVCGLNLQLIEGMIEETGSGHLHAKLDPRPHRCCVVVEK